MTTTYRLSERSRAWIVTAMALCLVLIFSAIWATYSGAHTYQRYRQLPPGATATVSGSTFRLVQLRQTETITDGEESHPSAAGAVWVIAEVELTLAHKDETPNCTLALISEDRRSWDATSSTFFDRKLPQYCGDYKHPITVGKPWRFEQVFEVPQRFADRLYGLAAPDPASSAAVEVIRPAA